MTIIVGGQDRGIDYGVLIDRLRAAPPCAVILLDASGRRIHDLLASSDRVHVAPSMRDAVALARALTPRGGVVLLSPAAPSYGVYRNFIERGEDFARCAGVLGCRVAGEPEAAPPLGTRSPHSRGQRK